MLVYCHRLMYLKQTIMNLAQNWITPLTFFWAFFQQVQILCFAVRAAEVRKRTIVRSSISLISSPWRAGRWEESLARWGFPKPKKNVFINWGSDPRGKDLGKIFGQENLSVKSPPIAFILGETGWANSHVAQVFLLAKIRESSLPSAPRRRRPLLSMGWWARQVYPNF